MGAELSNSYFVYVLQTLSGRVKIGTSANAMRRRGDLENEAKEALLLVYVMTVANRETAEMIEAALHQRYESFHINGDWFTADAQEMVKDIRLAAALAKIATQFQVAYFPAEQAVEGDDGLYPEALTLVYRLRKCSINLLQRRMGIGYNRAARFVRRMESEGVLVEIGVNKHGHGGYR